MNIEYEYITKVVIRIEGKEVGEIRKVQVNPTGWQYFPKGQNNGGFIYPNITQVKNSLEDEEDEEDYFILYYKCPECGKKWKDTWNCIVNGQCPDCDTRDIEPYKVSDAI